MEMARLVLEYIQALVWPTVAMTSVILFREPLKLILHRLKGAGLPGGISLDFDQEVRVVTRLSTEVANAPKEERTEPKSELPLTEANARMLSLGLQPSPSGLDMDRYADLAQQDPNIALAGLRMELDILTRNLAKGFKVEIRDNESASRLLRRLFDYGAISKEQSDLASKIIQLCNAAVHGTLVSKTDAKGVIDAARTLTKEYLDWLSWGFKDDTGHTT
ncbi:hypothetical protein K2Y11_00315 [bacterium]|nr:hypothetical protein [bacterium]